MKISRFNAFRLLNVEISKAYINPKKLKDSFENLKIKNVLKVVFYLLIFFFLFKLFGFYVRPKIRKLNPKIVIILGVNDDGGVFKWKDAKDWALEKYSIKNKRKYSERHGYALSIKNLRSQKRYSKMWRKSWQKVDLIKETMNQYPNAMWFWWLDINTIIMNTQISLEKHFLNNLNLETYRTLENKNYSNFIPKLHFSEYNNQIDLILTEDCNGINLGSFLIRRSEWSKMLLDLWWNKKLYEHMKNIWINDEQDALMSLYNYNSWIRNNVAFLPLRKINSVPITACKSEGTKTQFVFHKNDFLVNMSGCKNGRNCWLEMEFFKQLKSKLDKSWWRSNFNFLNIL